MRNLALGLTAAGVAFAAATPRLASSSTTTTLEQAACARLESSSWVTYMCGPPGGTALVAGPATAYFDVDINAGAISQLNLTLLKKTYTGTLSTDTKAIKNVAVGWHEYSISAVNTTATNSVWDYYMMEMDSFRVGDELVGMTLVSN